MTPYYKLIDYWMMFSMVMLMVTMMFHTFLNKLVRDAKKKEKEKEKQVVYNGTPKYMAPRIHVSKESLGVEGEEVEDDYLRMPKYFNFLAQIVFALLFVIFITFFWTVALSNYLAGPEAFLDTALY